MVIEKKTTISEKRELLDSQSKVGVILFRLTKSTNVPFSLKFFGLKFQHFTIGTNSWSISRRRELPTLHIFQYSLDGPPHQQQCWRIALKISKLATEVSLLQLAARGLPVRRRRKYWSHEKRLLTIKKKCEAGGYTLSELVIAFSSVGCHSS